MKDFKIENMDLSHIDDIMEIEPLCYGCHHWSRNAFVAELTNPNARYTTVVDKNRKCVGYMGIWQIIDEAHVTNLAVHPDFQGKGLAQLLILNAIENCYKEKVKYLTLEVRLTNERAKNIYKKFGFKSLGVRKKYYQDNGEDALIMWTESIFSDSYKELYKRNKEHLLSRCNCP